MSTDRIEKETFLRAPLARVWRAISDADEFGQWFGVRFDGPFVAGTSVTGVITPTTVDEEVARRQEPHAGRRTPGRSSRSSRSAGWRSVGIRTPSTRASTIHRNRRRWSSSRSPRPAAAYCCASSNRVSTRFQPIVGCRRSRPTARAGPSRPNWCASTWRSARTCERVHRHHHRHHKGALVRCARRPQSPADRHATVRWRPMLDIEVTEVVPVSRQAATKHLLLLAAVGLVSSERHGRVRIWRIEPKPLSDASEYLTTLSKRWDDAIDRLRAYVEDA